MLYTAFSGSEQELPSREGTKALERVFSNLLKDLHNMKKTIIALMTLAGMATAADVYYTGSDGGWWEVGSNWSTGLVLTADDVAWIGYNTDGSVSSSPITVKLGNNGGNHTQYGYTVNIAAGSQYIVTSAASDYKAWGSTFNIYGTNGLKIEATLWGDYKNGAPDVGRTPLVLNFAESGSALVTNTYTSAASAHMNLFGILDTTHTEAEIGALALGKRTLITFTGAVSGDFAVNDTSHFTSSFTTLSGQQLTLNNNLNLSGDLTDDMVGQYKLTYETLDNGDKAIIVNYVTKYAPEPATAVLSLLALAGLATRRRRK